METIINDSIEFLLYEIMIFPFQICLIAFLIYTAYLGILDYQYKTITKGTLIGLSIITFIQLINDFYSHYHRCKDATIFKFCPASYFGNVIISILIAIALLTIIFFVNKKKGEMINKPEICFVLSLAIITHPVFLSFIILLFLLIFAVIKIINIFKFRKIQFQSIIFPLSLANLIFYICFACIFVRFQ